MDYPMPVLGALSITDHRYVAGDLSYLVTTAEGPVWVDAESITDDSDVRQYWNQFARVRAAERPSTPIRRVYIQEPSRIIEVRQARGETYLLSEFEGVDVPVLVPITTARNAWPQKLIDFLEAELRAKESGA
jgi:hypothetical protein